MLTPGVTSKLHRTRLAELATLAMVTLHTAEAFLSPSPISSARNGLRLATPLHQGPMLRGFQTTRSNRRVLLRGGRMQADPSERSSGTIGSPGANEPLIDDIDGAFSDGESSLTADQWIDLEEASLRRFKRRGESETELSKIPLLADLLPLGIGCLLAHTSPPRTASHRSLSSALDGQTELQLVCANVLQCCDLLLFMFLSCVARMLTLFCAYAQEWRVSRPSSRQLKA